MSENPNLLALVANIAANTLTAGEQAVLITALENIIPTFPEPDEQGSADAVREAELQMVAALFSIAANGGGGPVPPGLITDVTGTAPIVVTPIGTTRVVSITPATDVAAGSMSAADKAKLDSLADGTVLGADFTNPAVNDSATGVVLSNYTNVVQGQKLSVIGPEGEGFYIGNYIVTSPNGVSPITLVNLGGSNAPAPDFVITAGLLVVFTGAPLNYAPQQQLPGQVLVNDSGLATPSGHRPVTNAFSTPGVVNDGLTPCADALTTWLTDAGSTSVAYLPVGTYLVEKPVIGRASGALLQCDTSTTNPATGLPATCLDGNGFLGPLLYFCPAIPSGQLPHFSQGVNTGTWQADFTSPIASQNLALDCTELGTASINGLTTLTITATITPKTVPRIGTESIFFSHGEDGTAVGFGITGDLGTDNELVASINTTSFLSGVAVPGGADHVVRLRYDGTDVRMFIDGTLVFTQAFSEAIVQTQNQTACWGASYGSWPRDAQLFDCEIPMGGLELNDSAVGTGATYVPVPLVFDPNHSLSLIDMSPAHREGEFIVGLSSVATDAARSAWYIWHQVAVITSNSIDKVTIQNLGLTQGFGSGIQAQCVTGLVFDNCFYFGNNGRGVTLDNNCFLNRGSLYATIFSVSNSTAYSWGLGIQESSGLSTWQVTCSGGQWCVVTASSSALELSGYLVAHGQGYLYASGETIGIHLTLSELYGSDEGGDCAVSGLYLQGLDVVTITGGDLQAGTSGAGHPGAPLFQLGPNNGSIAIDCTLFGGGGIFRVKAAPSRPIHILGEFSTRFGASPWFYTGTHCALLFPQSERSTLAVPTGDADVALTDAQFFQAKTYLVQGATTAPRTLTVPYADAGYDVLVWNQTGGAFPITFAGAVIPDGMKQSFVSDGTGYSPTAAAI